MVYEFGEFRLDPQRRVLLHVERGRVEIAAKAFDALLFLIEHHGVVVTRAELMKALWPRTVVEDNSLTKLIASIRRALGDPQHIATLQGRGYQFVADVHLRSLPEETVPQARADGSSATDDRLELAVAAKSFDLRALYAGVGILIVAVGAALVAGYRGSGDPGRLGPVVSVTPVTAYQGDEFSPSLSPDGTRVAFSWADMDGNRDIYITMTDGTGLHRLTDAPARDGDPAWSPDGKRIAFLRSVTAVQRDIFLIPALGGAEQYVGSVYLRTISAVNVAAPKITWTNDGRHLVYASGREGAEGMHIYALVPGTGEMTRLTDGHLTYDSSPAISPDGDWLAFRRDTANPSPVGALMLQELGPDLARRGEPTQVPGTSRAVFHSTSWSSDGTYLTFVTGGTIREWERGSGAPRLVHNASGVLGGSTSSSAEVSVLSLYRGRSLTIGVAARIGADEDVWGIPLDPRTRAATGPASVRFYSSARDLQPRFSPDGRRVAFLSNRSGSSQLWVGAANQSDQRQLTDVDADYLYYPNWSPDGEKLVFYTAGSDGFQIYIVDADGRGPPQHIGPGGAPWWSADGEHLYLSAFDAENGSTVTRVRISDGHRDAAFSGHAAFESQDGRRLLYWKGTDRHVFMRSLNGDPADGSEERLVETIVGGIALVDDGFYFVSVTSEGEARSFAFYEYATRTSYDVAPAPKGIRGTGDLTVAPDGSELLYSAQVTESGSDLMMLEFGASDSR